MQIKVETPHVEITPTLLNTAYEAGDILFTPIKLVSVTRSNYSSALLRQVGIFWDIANAPNITLYLFAKDPENWGNAGDAPAPTLDERATLVGEWSVNAQAPYSMMPGANSTDNSYALTTGLLAALHAPGGKVYLTATIDAAHSGGLEDKLKITLNIDKLVDRR